ncbi:MAG TPA: alpha-amylase family protein, partial [Armatimonadota bacterium]|nr:alpha-amylase family protein [Armatimonadota bacterium]
MNRIHITRSAVTLLLLLALGIPSRILAAPQQKHPLPEWLRCPRFYTEASVRDAAKAYKPGEITALVRNVAGNNGSALCLGVYRNGEAFFQSRVAPHAPELGQLDYLQEALAEGNLLGVKIIASINLDTLAREHPLYPECMARGINGKAWDLSLAGMKGAGYPCLNNPEYRRYLLSLVEEIFTRYAPDGLSIEGLSPHLCYCPVCRERYRAQFGKELPVQFAQFGPQRMLPDSSNSGDPDDDRLTHFLNDAAADLARAITQAVKRSHPSAVVLYPASRKQNTPGNYDGKLEEIAQDNPSLRSLWDIGELADYEAASPVPVLYPIPPRRHTDTEVRTKMWQTLANRAYPNVESLQGTAPVFAYLKENAGYYDFARVQPVRFLAFPRSLSNDLIQQHLAPQESATAPFLDSDRGMYSALQQARLPIVTLHRDQLSESLQGFRVLVLADEAILSDQQIQDIIRFVREGGGLIATHETSLYDGQGRRRANFGLAALFGADYLETLPGVSTKNATAQSDRVLCFAPALGIRKPQPAPEAHVLVRPTDASVVGTLRGTGIP